MEENKIEENKPKEQFLVDSIPADAEQNAYNWPRGSVRATITLIILIFSFLYMWTYSTLPQDLLMLLNSCIAFYFAGRMKY